MSSAKGPILVALVANFLIAIGKYAAAGFTGSAAMLAEAYHSTSDCLNQVFLLIGLKRSKKAADAAHPFGYGKAAYFWSFVVAVLIFGIAGTLSFVHGIEKLLHPHAPDPGEAVWAWSILGAAFVFEAFALWVTIKELKKSGKGRGLREELRRSKDAALITIMFEDALALMGLVIAGAGLGMALVTGDGRWDGAASLVVGLMLMGFALVLANRNRKFLLGEAADPDVVEKINEVVAANPNVNRLVSLRTMHLKADEILVALQLNFVDGLTTDQLERVIDEVQAAVCKATPEIGSCFVELES